MFCCCFSSLDVAAVADSFHITDSMLRQILDGLMQPITFDVRDRKLRFLFCAAVD